LGRVELSEEEYISLLRDAGRLGVSRDKVETQERAPAAKKKRKASAANQKYSRAFAQVKKQYQKKDGSWKKNGFRNAVRAAHKKAKRMR
tara:strand:- start:311 stop:577 length:267 start_codon:yes stop_codon:yes gene_type:complete